MWRVTAGWALALGMVACGDDAAPLGPWPDGGVPTADGGLGDSPSGAPQPPPPLCAIAIDCPQPIRDEPKIDCQGSVHHGDGTLQYAGGIGIEIRGRSSQAYPKKNYAIELRDAAGLEQSVNLLGMGGESDWVLDGSWIDRSFLRNPIAFDVYRSFGPGRYAARSRFCELTLDGDEVGIYRLTERIKRDDDRIAIAADDGSGSSFVIKQDDDGALRWDIGEQARWKLVYPRQELASPQQIDGVQAFLDGLDDALRSGDPGDPVAGVFAWLDMDAMADWVIIEEVAKNIDAYNLSGHLFRDAGGLAHPVPWDFDLSMGQPDADDYAGSAEPSGWARRLSRLVQTMAEVPTFQQRVAERYRSHRRGPLSDAAVMAIMDRYLVTLDADAIDANFQRWPIEDVDFRPIYRVYGLYRVDNHPAEVARLRQWLTERLAWLDANIDHFVDGND